MKKKPRTELALEMCAEAIAKDAMVNYPHSADPLDLAEWGKALMRVIVEIAKRRDLAFQPTYKDMPVEEVANRMLDLSWEKVGEIAKLENRKAGADVFLNLEVPEPPIVASSDSDSAE